MMRWHCNITPYPYHTHLTLLGDMPNVSLNHAGLGLHVAHGSRNVQIFWKFEFLEMFSKFLRLCLIRGFLLNSGEIWQGSRRNLKECYCGFNISAIFLKFEKM